MGQESKPSTGRVVNIAVLLFEIMYSFVVRDSVCDYQ